LAQCPLCSLRFCAGYCTCRPGAEHHWVRPVSVTRETGLASATWSGCLRRKRVFLPNAMRGPRLFEFGCCCPACCRCLLLAAVEVNDLVLRWILIVCSQFDHVQSVLPLLLLLLPLLLLSLLQKWHLPMLSLQPNLPLSLSFQIEIRHIAT